MRPELVNPLVLAYLGDGVFEVYVREHLIVERGIRKPDLLQKEAVLYVSAKAQSEFMKEAILNNWVSEEEIAIYKRGRNSHNHSVRKNIDIQSYMEATGFEAVIGYLYINKNPERIKELINICIEINKEVANG